MNKILLLGKYGQVGSELTNYLSAHYLVSLGRREADILDFETIKKKFVQIQPEIVINTIAYNDVDNAELNPEEAFKINSAANGFIADLCKENGALYITYSSDFVFDGQKRNRYLEVDHPNPVNKYGESKLEGDLAVQRSNAAYLIFRTSSVYSLQRPCFLTKIIQQAKSMRQVYVRSDLVSSPTSAQFLAQITARLINLHGTGLRKYSGLYHLCSSGAVSRYEWATAINNSLNLGATIIPVYETELRGAPRPVYSALSNQLFQNTFGMEIPQWDKMLYSLLEQ